MSRLDTRLERDLRRIADRATPSPDAWDSILTRIADQHPTEETEIIMLVENTTPVRRRALVVAAAAAVIAMVVGVVALVVRRGDDAPQVPADEVPATTTARNDAGASAPDELPPASEPIPPGRYTTSKFGVTLAFDVPTDTDSPWTVQVNDDVALTIGDPDGFVNLSRVGSFYDAGEARDPQMSGLGSIDPAGIDTWIDANGVVVDEEGETTIGGRDARYRLVTAPADAAGGCPPELQPCLPVTSASADLQDVYSGPSTAVYGERPHAFWLIELDDFEPLAIWAHSERSDHASWLDEIAPLIASIEIGEPAPAVAGGSARLSTFGGATIPFPAVGTVLDPGRYTSDSAGVPVTLTLGEGQTAPWTLVADQEPGGIQLWSDDTAREFIAIGRVGSWYDFDQARAEGTTGLGSIPPDDIDGWIEQNGIIVVDRADVVVGDRPAKFRRIRLDTTPGATADFCPPGEQPCLWAASGSADTIDDGSTPVPFSRDRLHSIWLVDMGEFEPLVVLAIPNLSDEQAWFDETVQPIVDSIAFGEPAPVVPGGVARLPERVTVTATMTVNQTGEPDPAEPWPVERTGSLDGDVVGTYTGTGVSSPDGAEVTLDWTMDVTIDGLGSGTLTLRSRWVRSGDGATAATDHVIGGTGDLDGVTGFGTTTQSSDLGPGVEYTADIELQLAPPTG